MKNFFTKKLYDQLSEEHKALVDLVDLHKKVKFNPNLSWRKPSLRIEREKFYHSRYAFLSALVSPPAGPILPENFSNGPPWLI